MSTKTSRKTTTKSNDVSVSIVQEKEQVPSVSDKQQQLNELMKKLNKLETLKKYYSNLKVKRNDLQESLDKMEELASKTKEHFEENEREDFPFEISLKGIGQYDRMEEIFKISKKETVTSFTKYLLNELNQVLKTFENDLINLSKQVNV